MRSSRLALVLVAVAACSPELVQRPEPPPYDRASLEAPATVDGGAVAPTEREKQIAGRYMAALSSPTFDGLDKLVDEDASFLFVGNKLDAHGRREVLAAHDKLFGQYAPRAFAATRVLLTDRNQIVEWVLTGQDRDSHAPIGFRGVTLVDTKDDGTLRTMHVYFDEAIPRAQRGDEPKQLRALPMPQPPASAPQVVEQTHMAAAAANAKVASDWLDALENNDVKYVSLMTPDVEVQTQESAKPMKGPADALAYFRAMHKVFGLTLDTQLGTAWSIGDYVVVEYQIVGQMNAAIAFVPPTHQPVTLHDVDVITMQNGKIARVARYDDPGQIIWQP